MVVNPVMALPDGYMAVNLAGMEWQHTPNKDYFHVGSDQIGVDISLIDTDTVRCGKYEYVGLVGDAEVTPYMDLELSIYKNLAGVRIIDHRYKLPIYFSQELGDKCYMIFKLK